MKQALLLFFLLSFFSVAFTQSNQWAWMQGDFFPQLPVYGVKGISTSINKPGARRNIALWKDTSGNTWMFGGTSASTNNYERLELNDLWRYMPSTGQWTWMSGDSTANRSGVYGTKGLAAAVNKPGARYSAVTWTDALGNLWMFGGLGNAASNFGDLNDLWKYMPSTGQWTWVNGDSTAGRTGIYGVKGVAASTNKPCAREFAVGTADASGNLWLFGGSGYTFSTRGYLNDLWKYTPATNQWTWISGDSTTGLASVYGIKGTASPDNKPGGRYAGEDAAGFAIIQNPVQNMLQLQVQLPAALKLMLQVKDISGHLLVSEERMGNKGSSVLSIPVGRLSGGVYFIHVQSKSINSTKTFVKR